MSGAVQLTSSLPENLYKYGAKPAVLRLRQLDYGHRFTPRYPISRRNGNRLAGRVLGIRVDVSWAAIWRTDTASITIGSSGRGTLAVLNGASVATRFLDIGGNAGGSGGVTVNGSGSVIQTTGMRMGTAGAGTLAIQNGGRVNNNGNVFIGNGASGRAGSRGTVSIGAAASDAAAAPGTLAASSVEFGPGAGLLVFNHTAADHTFVPGINGPGAVSVLSGTTSSPTKRLTPAARPSPVAPCTES